MNYKGKKWVVRPQDPETALQIAEALDTTSLVGQVLLNRGFGDIEDAAQFLNCQLADLIDPYVLHGMKDAVDRIILSLEKKEKTLVYGDYDVDGVTATSLILLFLRDLGFSTHYYIPKRVEEGYGVNKESLRKFSEEGVGLIITVDCGISSVEEIAYANSLGMSVIVTDHHEPPIKLPDAVALINPLLAGCPFPYKALSGVGLAFYLIAGLRKELREKGFFKEGEEPSLVHYLDLVAVGTIADIVPLTGINRILVRAGLEQINVNPRLGIKTLLDVCGIQPGHVDSSSVAYRLAPKINAAGRLSDAMRGVLLLTTESREDAEREAGFLDVENEERQRIEGKIYAEAVEMIQSNGIEKDFRSIVLSSADWHPGVVGIVASRLMERYYRPTILLCLDNGVYKGSARGIPNFHLYQGLARCRDLLLEFGGHKYAAGIKVVPENLEKFTERFESVVREVVPEDGFTQVMKLDAETSLEALGMEEVSKFQGLAPFGAGNPEPVILIKDVEILNPKVVGRDHLSFLARQNGVTMGAIAFRQAHELEHLKEKMELAAVPEVQVWRGVSQVKLRVKGMRAAEDK
ncbi:MAG: single-stranded-DNA-specific exonuclease RecJ [bacterium]|nr:single-stranded-DNA-specific exonuclease RecJ [bacterium]MDT8365358.1 single-stranded-DNA-specific exonuclease RecJ [bacterium]